jgi:hypothetical protein
MADPARGAADSDDDVLEQAPGGWAAPARRADLPVRRHSGSAGAGRVSAPAPRKPAAADVVDLLSDEDGSAGGDAPAWGGKAELKLEGEGMPDADAPELPEVRAAAPHALIMRRARGALGRNTCGAPAAAHVL